MWKMIKSAVNGDNDGQSNDSCLHDKHSFMVFSRKNSNGLKCKIGIHHIAIHGVGLTVSDDWKLWHKALWEFDRKPFKVFKVWKIKQDTWKPFLFCGSVSTCGAVIVSRGGEDCVCTSFIFILAFQKCMFLCVQAITEACSKMFTSTLEQLCLQTFLHGWIFGQGHLSGDPLLELTSAQVFGSKQGQKTTTGESTQCLLWDP